MPNIELARAYVTIVPSMEGAQQTIAEELSGVDFSEQGSSGGSSFGEGFAGALASAGSIALSIGSQIASGLADGATALANFTAGGGAYADEVLTMSTNTHIAADELQAYMYAAELVDVSTSTLTSSMARNVRSMNSAADGTGAVAEAYAALGVAVTDQDGNLRDSQTVYWELIDALGNVDDYTQRDALSMQIFGRSAQDLNSLIAVGSDGMEEYAQQARDAGAILDGETLDAFHAFDDVTHQLDSGMQAAQNALGTILLPVLTEMGTSGVDLLGQFTNGILAANGDIGQMGEVINTLAPQLTSMIQTYLPTLVEVGVTLISTLAQALIANLPILLEGAGEILRAIGQGIIQVLPELAPVAADLIVDLAMFVVENLPLIIEAGIQILLAVVNGIIDALPELIPAAVQCVMEICQALTEPDTLEQLVLAAIQLIIALTEGIIEAIPDLLEGAGEVVSNLIEYLIEKGPEIAATALEWGADLIQSLVDGILGGIGYVEDAVSSVAQSIRDFIGFSEPEKGPLSNFHTYMPDMYDMLEQGIEEGAPGFEATLNRSLSMPIMAEAGSVSEYSPEGDVNGGNIVIPVYIGQQQLDTILVRSEQMSIYRRGG